MAELVIKGKTSYLCYKGYIYIKHSSSAASKYWRCKFHRECSARLTSTVDDEGNIVVKKGGDVESHNHAPNPEEVQALKLLTSMTRQASEHPDEPPSRIMRRLQDAPKSVLAQLPERENIRKQIQRERLKELPTNPTSIEDLQEIPDRYRMTKNGDNFLLYDSYEDDSYTTPDARIIIFSSTHNLRQHFKSQTWFVDGTFSVVPTLFFQLCRNGFSVCTR